MRCSQTQSSLYYSNDPREKFPGSERLYFDNDNAQLSWADPNASRCALVDRVVRDLRNDVGFITVVFY